MKFHHFWPLLEKSFWLSLKKSTIGPSLAKIIPTPMPKTCFSSQTASGEKELVVRLQFFDVNFDAIKIKLREFQNLPRLILERSENAYKAYVR